MILYTVIRVHARVYEQGVHYVWHMHYKVIRMLHFIIAILMVHTANVHHKMTIYGNMNTLLKFMYGKRITIQGSSCDNCIMLRPKS